MQFDKFGAKFLMRTGPFCCRPTNSIKHGSVCDLTLFGRYLTAAMKRKNHQRHQTSVNYGTDEKEKESASNNGSFHQFSEEEVESLQTKLLSWYDANKRDLPWRLQSGEPDVNKRAYQVWVSEIMLQQTQVATVIDYYKKWIKKWPSLQDLAKASLEDVNEMWSGLGYYSRGRRLFEGAQKVVKEFNGEMPRCAEDLQKELPGVGRYTAGAVASIALGQKTGVVDGNVIRVLSRLRMIGADSTSQTTMDAFWNLANCLAKCKQPGCLNQGLMELGATVCTPKCPQCSTCPLRDLCKAYAKVEIQKEKNACRLLSQSSDGGVADIECLVEGCKLCLSSDDPWDSSLGVQNFPRKRAKKAAREQTSFVCIIARDSKDTEKSFLVLQRPNKGLLAGLWEFPSSATDSSDAVHPKQGDLVKQLKSDHGVHLVSASVLVQNLGQVVHIFSHIRQTYIVSMVTVSEDNVEIRTEKASRWLTEKGLEDAALSTAMRKVFRLYKDSQQTSKKGIKRKREDEKQDNNCQKSIKSFFRPRH